MNPVSNPVLALALALGLLAPISPVLAGTAKAGAAPADQGPASRYSLSLITILPGDSLYASFGHSAIRVIDRKSGRDVLYNYGLSIRPFDLAFALDMLKGKMDFRVGALDTGDSFDFYREAEDRTIIEQPLLLDSEGISRILAKLERDVRPENRVYNYRYFTNNCATKIWDILEPWLGEGPDAGGGSPARSTRQSLFGVIKPGSWLGFGLGFLLGPSADRPLPSGASVFLPGEIMDRAELSRIESAVPVIGEKLVIYQSGTNREGKGPFPPLAAFILLAAIALVLSLVTRPEKLVPRLFDAILFSAVSIAGIVIYVMWFSAGYSEAGFNLNLVWTSLLALVGLVWIWIRPKAAMPRALLFVELAVAGAVAVFGGLGMQGLSIETRLFALAIALRSAAALGLFAKLLPRPAPEPEPSA